VSFVARPFDLSGLLWIRGGVSWWLWVLLGFGLLACELVTPGAFFFMFFGLGAIVVGVVTWSGLVESPPLEWLLFSLVSLVFLVPLRGRLVRWVGSGDEAAKSVDALVGQTAVLLDDLPPGELGKAELRGSSWNARNGDDKALRKGQRGKVTRVDGLTLWLQAE
jgi:membrane protein implicated in regulation of membrane protease activity